MFVLRWDLKLENANCRSARLLRCAASEIRPLFLFFFVAKVRIRIAYRYENDRSMIIP